MVTHSLGSGQAPTYSQAFQAFRKRRDMELALHDQRKTELAQRRLTIRYMLTEARRTGKDQDPQPEVAAALEQWRQELEQVEAEFGSLPTAAGMLAEWLASLPPEIRPTIGAEVVREYVGEPEDPERAAQRASAKARQMELDNVLPQTTAERVRLMRLRGEWTAEAALAESGLLAERKTLESYQVGSYSKLDEAKDAVTAWLGGGSRFAPAYSRFALLTLGGGTGTGKSHLLAAAGYELVRRAQYIRYLDEHTLVGELHRRVKSQGVQDYLDDVAEVDWLILDDLGAAALNEFARAEIDQLIDRRWQAKRKTLIATNLKSSDLPARMASRLRDAAVSRAVWLDAPDGRVTRWWEA